MAAATTKKIIENSSKILALTDNLEDFLSAENSLSSQYTGPLKNLYDITKSLRKDSPSSAALQELIVTGFDDEQIWQQLELENDSSISNLLKGAAKILSNKNNCSFKPAKFDSLKSNYKSKKEKVVKGAQNITTVSVSEKSDTSTTSRLKQNSEENEYEDADYFDDEEEEGPAMDDEDDDDDDKDEDDDELADIENKLDEIDENDKFFDFTGDSDEDLNFDFGPLGQKGDLDEELFKDDSNDETESRKSKIKQRSL